jgi:aminoglycoside phosphotransferase (APT) family kinase protein
LPEAQERPTTSTRDYEELRARLQAWLGDRVDRNAEVSALETPAANGMSSETVLFDISAGGVTSHCVARIEPETGAVPVFPTYDLPKQFRVMQLVATATPVPVPRPLWLEPNSKPVGSPFFVMERVDGRVPPDLMPYTFGDNWLFDASRKNQEILQQTSIQTLADLHALDGEDPALAFLALDRPEATALGRHLGATAAYYDWVVTDGPRIPVLERCLAWLSDNLPDDEGPPVLSWGDSRLGNMLYRDFAPVAVLDWEMVGVAPREVDLAWMIFLHRFFEDLADQLGGPGMPHFMRIADVAGSYAELTGHEPRHLEWHTMYAALRHGAVMARVTQRSIHFGQAVMPDDPDELVMHHATLEEMLAGTYWKGL